MVIYTDPAIIKALLKYLENGIVTKDEMWKIQHWFVPAAKQALMEFQEKEKKVNGDS